jgi:hypothetical protein
VWAFRLQRKTVCCGHFQQHQTSPDKPSLTFQRHERLLDPANRRNHQRRLQQSLVCRAGMLLGSLPEKQCILERIELHSASGRSQRRDDCAAEFDCTTRRKLPTFPPCTGTLSLNIAPPLPTEFGNRKLLTWTPRAPMAITAAAASSDNLPGVTKGPRRSL